jgi:hypothetical protein
MCKNITVSVANLVLGYAVSLKKIKQPLFLVGEINLFTDDGINV